MPKTNIAYGNVYKSCPCAQINDYTTTNNTYFKATCFSPKRNGAIKISESEQVRICMGGTSHGKKYTACPYYVKSAKINVPRRTRDNSLGNALYHIMGCITFMVIAKTLISSGVQYADIIGLMFAALAIACIVTLFKKDEKIDASNRRKKRK